MYTLILSLVEMLYDESICYNELCLKLVYRIEKLQRAGLGAITKFVKRLKLLFLLCFCTLEKTSLQYSVTYLFFVLFAVL
jgi:hypothetical protein